VFGTGDPRDYMSDPNDWRSRQQSFMAAMAAVVESGDDTMAAR
jgi:hypothetical protein